MHVSEELSEPWAWNLEERLRAVRAAHPSIVAPGMVTDGAMRPPERTRVSSYPARVFALLAPPRTSDAPVPWAPAPAAAAVAERAPSTQPKSKRRVARWPVLVCGLFALAMSTEAFVRSPLAQVPAVRPYASSLERGLAAGHSAVASGAERASELVRSTLDRSGS